jgi:divalent metal cation (Fe/Co/Zn/Cd) transporter
LRLESRASLVSSALHLSYLTIAWNLVGGIAAFASALIGGSLALGGFGLNMLIDTSASAVLVWRFKHEQRKPDAADRLEERAEVAIGVAMLGVAVYLAIHAVLDLADRSHPKTPVLGLIVTIASLIALPWLASRKLRVASRLPSRALRADAILTGASAALAATTLAALLANSLFGWWWADASAALVVAALLALEGSRAAIRRLGLEFG